MAEYLFELHSDKPYPPEIAQTRYVVDQIIETNRLVYQDLRENIALKKDLSKIIVTTGFSISDMITIWRRYYLNVRRSRYLVFAILFNILIVSALCAGSLCMFYLYVKSFGKTKGYLTSSFSENVKVVQRYMTDNGRNLIILENFNVFFSFYRVWIRIFLLWFVFG